MADFVIENGVLTKYTGIGGDVVVPESVTHIGDEGSMGNYSTQSIKLPESLTSIGNGAFEDCENLTLYGQEHAYLIPHGARLPFIPKGKVFRLR